MGCAASEFEKPAEVVEQHSSRKKVRLQKKVRFQEERFMSMLCRCPCKTAISCQETHKAEEVLLRHIECLPVSSLEEFLRLGRALEKT